jgi:hypothetical protein
MFQTLRSGRMEVGEGLDGISISVIHTKIVKAL